MVRAGHGVMASLLGSRGHLRGERRPFRGSRLL